MCELHERTESAHYIVLKNTAGRYFSKHNIPSNAIKLLKSSLISLKLHRKTPIRILTSFQKFLD